MKQVVGHSGFRRNQYGISLASTAILTWLSLICFISIDLHSSTGSEEREVAVELQRASCLNRSHLSPEILLVSKIIREALPSHPDSYSLATLIVEESRRAHIDPLFITALIRAESTFQHGAISSRGARGLMQLTPETGLYIAGSIADASIAAPINLHDPATNIRLGIAYIKHLNERFSGDRQRALIAYNWGPTNLSNALRTKRSLPSGSLQYAQKILTNHKEWRSSLHAMAASSQASALG